MCNNGLAIQNRSIKHSKTSIPADGCVINLISKLPLGRESCSLVVTNSQMSMAEPVKEKFEKSLKVILWSWLIVVISWAVT
ncbi:hypothetical protein RS130_16020 [Paraglaciecola aquimarina]|uniref:Uncharacterized protein n=1 Tax=Paraglaciecola aquimarina TaxID=1235557 RepID=A0ABU3SYW8_9ALTE|nr:hypothetical protein [Paraglaciecola aquimarina]MDU0355204.1 hypothetical protein [Paraglaciecola aquimarina]